MLKYPFCVQPIVLSGPRNKKHAPSNKQLKLKGVGVFENVIKKEK